MDNNFEICLTSPNDQNIISLIEDLSQNLEKRFGSSGKNSFQDWKDNDSKYIFLSIVEHNEFIGCGGIRPLGNSIGEIKRMFAKYKSRGIGSVILDNLEKEAKKVGYTELWLETRERNIEACSFYQKHGYRIRPNYGKYVENKEAVCFSKKIIS